MGDQNPRRAVITSVENKVDEVGSGPEGGLGTAVFGKQEESEKVTGLLGAG